MMLASLGKPLATMMITTPDTDLQHEDPQGAIAGSPEHGEDIIPNKLFPEVINVYFLHTKLLCPLASRFQFFSLPNKQGFVINCVI